MVILSLWMSVTPPYVETVPTSPGAQELICHFPVAPFTTSFVINAILLIICAFFAFLTRKLPDNFNESRFIAFCVYSTLIIWLSVLPAYITATTSSLRVSLLCAMLILNASVPLILIYFPKVYAILYVSAESLHVRKTTTRSSHSNYNCPDYLDKVAPDLVSSSSVTGCKKTTSCATSSSAVMRRGDVITSNKVAPIVDTSICEKPEADQSLSKWI